MALPIQHRILFRHEQKQYLVHAGTILTIAGMTALSGSMTLSLVLVAHFLYGLWAAIIVGGASFVAFAIIWYAMPIGRRRSAGPARDDPDEDAPAVTYPHAP